MALLWVVKVPVLWGMELTAVETETLFEKSRKMAIKRPELYGELKEFYKMDPADWF